jgi:hypothetical protein
MKEQWRKDMRQKLADYQKPAPVLSWTDIEQVVAVQRSGAVMTPIRRKWVAVAAAVILAVGGFYLAFHQKEDMIGVQDQHLVKAEETVKKGSHTSPDVSSEVLIPQKTSKAILSAEEMKPVMEKEENRQEEIGEDTISKDIRQDPTVPVFSPNKMENGHYYQDQEPLTKKNNRLTAKVYLSNTMAGNTGGSSAGGTYVNSMPSSDPVNVGSTIPQSTSYREEIHHRQPIRLGVSLHYPLNDRWGIESGLSYTRLLSDITRKSATQTIHIEQKLSYIGIPVNVTYCLWNNRRFSCYLSAGVMAEMMITGNRTSEGKEENLKNQPLQFSINGAAGAEYQLGNVLGLFAEPGLSYHFKNSSDIPTFYQENPLGFNLNLGIRFYLNRHNTAR